MIVIMLGAPGTGKGTVGKFLSEKLQIPHISSGDIFRSYVTRSGEVGKKVQEYMNSGGLIPDELVMQIIEMRLSEPDVENGAVLDGYPRTVAQAEALDKWLASNNKEISVAPNLTLSDEEIIDRLTKRMVCSNKNCGETYSMDYKGVKETGLCSKCSAKLEQRQDDNVEVIKNRLKTYHDLSEALVDYYEKKNILYPAKVDVSVENISMEIADEIKDYLEQ